MDAGSLGVLIPIVAIATWGVVKVATIQAQGRATGLDRDSAARLEALEQEVGALRHELSEAQERLDFSERLLAQHRPERSDPPK